MGGASEIFGKLIFERIKHMLSPNLSGIGKAALWERDVYITDETEMACGSKEFDPPFPFPPRGTPGRGWFPPRRCMFRASQNRWHGPCSGSPRKRATPPCAIPHWPQPMYSLPLVDLERR